MLILEDKTLALEKIKQEVNCPLKAMSIEGTDLICNCALVNFKSISKVSLGNIRKDVLANCGECKLKLKKQDDKYQEIVKLQKINESNEVLCPADEKNVSPEDTCVSCTFFNKEKAKEIMGENVDKDIEFIPCNYPNLTPENLKVFLAKKKITRKKPSASEKAHKYEEQEEDNEN